LHTGSFRFSSEAAEERHIRETYSISTKLERAANLAMRWRRFTHRLQSLRPRTFRLCSYQRHFYYRRQIYLESDLFYAGVRPINVGFSVSRWEVGPDKGDEAGCGTCGRPPTERLQHCPVRSDLDGNPDAAFKKAGL
jgi:hypothetical protein